MDVTLDGNENSIVGRLIEIKCPYTRDINIEGDEICPDYYWI
jgi:hypothetical protein